MTHTDDGSHNLAELAQRRHDAGDPDHETLLFEGRWHTAGALHECSTRLSAGYAGLGVEPGDRVVVVGANTPDIGVTYTALWRCGAVATPVMFLLPPPELRQIIIDCEARAVFTTPEFLANVQQAVEGLGCTIVLDGEAPGTVALSQLLEAEPGPIVPRSDDDLAALLYTGGTTGRAKGVMLTHAGLWHAGRIGYANTAHDRLSRTIVPLPLAHSFGLLVTAVGMHDPDPSVTVLMRWFDPAAFVQLVEEHRVEQATLVPTMLRLLLLQPLADHDLSSLTRVVCGSAPLPPDVLEAFEAQVPSATVVEGYGLTETAAAATVNHRDARKVGSVGRPLPEVEVRILDVEGREVPIGEAGEVHLRSPSNAAGYWNAPQETAATFVDGWVRTGDIGALDQDGFLTILDRAKDVIIRNGFNVYPRDVEDTLTEHPAIASAAVVGRPDPRVDEEVVAFVQLAPDADVDVDDLLAWARERLGAKSHPREIRVVDAIPLTPVLKVDRKALRAQLQGEEPTVARQDSSVTATPAERHLVVREAQQQPGAVGDAAESRA